MRSPPKPVRNRRPLQSASRWSSLDSATPSSSGPQTRVLPAPIVAAARARRLTPQLLPQFHASDYPSKNFQVGLECAGLFHRLQNGDYVARTRTGALQFLDQIFDSSSLFQIDTVHRLVLGLYRGLLHHLRRT